jgi:coproporphyrinogen III oxidase
MIEKWTTGLAIALAQWNRQELGKIRRNQIRDGKNFRMDSVAVCRVSGSYMTTVIARTHGAEAHFLKSRGGVGPRELGSGQHEEGCRSVQGGE